MGGGGDKAPGQYMGWWGNLGSPAQKGVTTYGLSQNRQKAMGGALHNAVFNTARRTKQQVLYWATPLLIGYLTFDWATHRAEYLNSKAGRLEYADEE